MWVGIAIVVLMCLFPPWMGKSKFEGYALLFSGPSSDSLGGGYRGVQPRIDFTRIIMQCAIVCLITGALLYTLNNMNRKQKIVLWIGIGVIVLMCLFPPWLAGDEGEFEGYTLLFSGPLNGTGGYLNDSPRIDFTRFMMQCAIVGLITGALLYTLISKTDEQKQ